MIIYREGEVKVSKDINNGKNLEINQIDNHTVILI